MGSKVMHVAIGKEEYLEFAESEFDEDSSLRGSVGVLWSGKDTNLYKVGVLMKGERGVITGAEFTPEGFVNWILGCIEVLQKPELAAMSEILKNRVAELLSKEA